MGIEIIVLIITGIIVNVTGIIFGIAYKNRFIRKGLREHDLKETEIKGLKQLNENQKSFLYLDFGIPWLSITLVVRKDKALDRKAGEIVELSELIDERENAILVYNHAFNLSTQFEDHVKVQILNAEKYGEIIALTGILC